MEPTVVLQSPMHSIKRHGSNTRVRKREVVTLNRDNIRTFMVLYHSNIFTCMG
jgi:hypothetical protein